MKVSVIVPIYNMSKYLSRCIDSIVKQTYINIEIILVNDGSTDNSFAICKSYNIKDKRVILVDKPNGGLSDARNAGMAIASGEYIAFVDSDDWIEKEYIEKLLSSALKYNADLVACGYKQVSEVTGEDIIGNKYLLFESSNMIVDLTEKNLDEFLIRDKNKFSNVAWNKLYKSNIIKENDIKYMLNQDIFSEDVLFNNSYFIFCKRLVLIEDVLYNYSIRDGSLSNSERPRLTEQLLNLADFYNDFVDKHHRRDMISGYLDWIYCEMSLISLSALSNYGIQKIKNTLKRIHSNEKYIHSIKKGAVYSKSFTKIRLKLLTVKKTSISSIILFALYKSKAFLQGDIK